MIPRVQVVSLIHILVWYSSANIEEKKNKHMHTHTQRSTDIHVFPEDN